MQREALSAYDNTMQATKSFSIFALLSTYSLSAAALSWILFAIVFLCEPRTSGNSCSAPLTVLALMPFFAVPSFLGALIVIIKRTKISSRYLVMAILGAFLSGSFLLTCGVLTWLFLTALPP